MDQISKRLKQTYSINTEFKLINELIQLGIPNEEAHIILEAIERSGKASEIEVCKGKEGTGYEIHRIDYSNFIEQHTNAEIERKLHMLNQKIINTTSLESRRLLMRQLQETKIQVFGIYVNYCSLKELDKRMINLRAYLDITLQIMNLLS